MKLYIPHPERDRENFNAISLWANTRILGTAALTAGTVTVARTEVMPGSLIFVEYQTIAGTPGYLRVSSIASGSFTVTSYHVVGTGGPPLTGVAEVTNTADTSTISYAIFLKD